MATTLVAMYDRKNQAEDAVQELTGAGLERDTIKLVSHDGKKGKKDDKDKSSGGFWQNLFSPGTPEEDVDHHAEGVRRGSSVVTLTVDDARADEIEEILHRHDPVDVNERVEKWREEGYSTHDREAPAYSADEVEAERKRHAIPVVEEDITVGKREVKGGKRIRTYVTETPVEEQVTLREEDIRVKRRDVDRAVTDADDPFQERTVEMTETDEEVVVSKEAHVTGEVVVGKETTEHTETVTGVKRKTEVEVEELDGKAAG